MTITIRPLGPDDAEQYRACCLYVTQDAPTSLIPTYEEMEPRTVEMLRELFISKISKPDVTFGAFDGEQLIGLTGIFREERQKRRHKMNLVSVFVRPEYRGKRVGFALVEAALAYARTVEGVEHIELSVRSDNTPAKAIYTSFGFKTWGTEPAFLKLDGSRYDEDYMTLKL